MRWTSLSALTIALITSMDRGIGMDAFITAGPQDIGDGTITVDTGITATTTIDTGIAVKSGLLR
jgi:hypothetical protein